MVYDTWVGVCDQNGAVCQPKYLQSSPLGELICVYVFGSRVIRLIGCRVVLLQLLVRLQGQFVF